MQVLSKNEAHSWWSAIWLHIAEEHESNLSPQYQFVRMGDKNV